jgi:hypothetical protein
MIQKALLDSIQRRDWDFFFIQGAYLFFIARDCTKKARFVIDFLPYPPFLQNAMSFLTKGMKFDRSYWDEVILIRA